MVAAATISAFERIQEFYGGKGTVKPSQERALAVFDEALTFARGGIEALQRSPPPAT
jgi:hypothetical protein